MCGHPTLRVCNKHDLQEIMRLMTFDFMIYNMDRWRHDCPGNNNVFSMHFEENNQAPLQIVYIDQAQYSLGEGYEGYNKWETYTGKPKVFTKVKDVNQNMRMLTKLM